MKKWQSDKLFAQIARVNCSNKRREYTDRYEWKMKTSKCSFNWRKLQENNNLTTRCSDLFNRCLFTITLIITTKYQHQPI